MTPQTTNLLARGLGYGEEAGSEAGRGWGKKRASLWNFDQPQMVNNWSACYLSTGCKDKKEKKKELEGVRREETNEWMNESEKTAKKKERAQEDKRMEMPA